MSTNKLNGGQVIVDYLIREKVPYAFGLCGHGNIQFIDALYERQADIKTVSVHHESVAGFMADVYYRVSGQPTATFTSCGPGSANLPISLTTAYLDSVPFLAVTGNVPTNQFNRGAFQEMYRQYQADFPSMVRACCKKVYQPTRGEQVPLMVRQAWKTMVTGRPGPVVLDVPFDVFLEAAAEEAPNPQEWSANISSRCGADPEGVVKAVDMLLAAERPCIIVGQGVRWGGATQDLLKLAERLQIPVAASMSGLGAIDTHHPLALGLVARGGHYQANHATRQADVLLALGVRFDDRTSSSWIPGYSFTIPPTKLIHVDIDPEEIGRNYPVALGLMADVRTFLRQVHAELDRRADLNQRADARKKWLQAIDGYRKEWDKLVAPGFTDDSQPINPQRAAAEIDSIELSFPTQRLAACAAPSYLAAREEPHHPEHLALHSCIATPSEQHGPAVWHFVDSDGDAQPVTLDPSYTVNSPLLVRLAAIAGMGIAVLPESLVADDFATGTLKRIMPGYTVDESQAKVSLVYPRRRHLPAKTRAFVDYTIEHAGSPAAVLPAVAHTIVAHDLHLARHAS